jgi:hypothetical protein
MQKIASQISLLVFVGLLTPLVTSCGASKEASKVVQCRSIAKITKEAGGISEGFDKSVESTKDPNKLTKLLTDTSAKMLKLNKDMKALEVQDEKLKGFQSRIAKTYLDYGQNFASMSSAAKSKNRATYDKSLAKVQALGTEQVALIDEFGNYCVAK